MLVYITSGHFQSIQSLARFAMHGIIIIERESECECGMKRKKNREFGNDRTESSKQHTPDTRLKLPTCKPRDEGIERTSLRSRKTWSTSQTITCARSSRGVQLLSVVPVIEPDGLHTALSPPLAVSECPSAPPASPVSPPHPQATQTFLVLVSSSASPSSPAPRA